MAQELSFDAIGTSWRIVIENLTETQLRELKKEIATFISEYDHWYSRFKPDSFITKVAEESTRSGIKTYALPKHSEALFELYQILFELSGGLFTACVGHALEQTGYDAQYSLKPKDNIEATPSFDIVDFSPTQKESLPTLSIPQCSAPLVLDFGAAGKGYLVDLIGSLISEKNPNTNWFINASGDILHHSPASTATTTIKPITIGLEHPLDTTKAIGTATIQNKSICGSAGNRRKWSTYHHILNPKTKTSPEHILATWVIADSGLIADGLATALYFVSPETLQTKFDFEYVILYTDGTAYPSKKFTGQLYT